MTSQFTRNQLDWETLEYNRWIRIQRSYPQDHEGTEMAAQTSMGKRAAFHPTRFITLHAEAAAKSDQK